MKKILILAANPNTTTRLRLEQEVRDIEAGLSRAQRRDDFKLVHKSAVRPRDIQRAMLDETPQIVHFSGHGEGEEGLVFEDDTGNVKFVRGEALAALFDLFASDVECVLLNGCYSKVQAEAIAEHIDYVIGMSQAISDDAAIEFAVSFYDALGAGRTYEFAYKLACNAIQLNASLTSRVATRKLIPVDVAGESKGEHLIPVLLKRPGASVTQGHIPSGAETGEHLEAQTKKATLEANLLAVESAGQARIESLDKRISEEESKLQETVEAHVKEALEWLKKNEKKLSQDAKNHALAKHADIFKDLSVGEQDDFRWEIEKYIEAVYFSMLSDSFDLLDDPIVEPSVDFSEIYRAAFELIKKNIPTRLNQKSKELVFGRFDYLLERLFII
jgi:CHAT domain